MEKLSVILEEAQSIASDDGYNFLNNNRVKPFTFPDNISMPYETVSLDFSTKPMAHKGVKAQKKRTWKKPFDKPKRPLSAYNLFFKEERERILFSISDDMATVDVSDGLTEEMRRRRHRKTHGKIGFADLARSIADQWKLIDKFSRSTYETQADVEKVRYKAELEVWMKSRKNDESKVPKGIMSAKIQSATHPSLASMMAASRMRNQLLHQQLMLQHQALMSQQQMQTLMGLPSMIQQQQQHIMILQQQVFSGPTLPSMTQLSVSIPNCVDMRSITGEQYVAPDVSFSSFDFFDDEPLPMEHESVVTVESDLSSLEDDLTNFMNDFEAELL